MASRLRGVWAIDVGNNSLKALRLRLDDGDIEVIGFDYIEHSKVLAGDKSVCKEEADQIMIDTLHTFAERNDIAKDEVAIAVAGQNSFARFIKLPPVEPKGIPKIVQYEAVQQIPFDINEVEWDWQLMSEEGSEDAEVGIFAIKNELINDIMAKHSKENLKVSCIQISPMALYNYLSFDQKGSVEGDNKPVVIIDVGAENTTLVVCTKTSVWQRTIRIGGNAFTEAIADAFKLRFRKAEKLKRAAPMSKYMRQLFSAMKPVFTDLGSEVQRSLGFYSSSNSDSRGFSKIIALGGGMKLQGLAKYLQKSIGIPVIKPDSFERLKVSEELSTAKFHENVSDYAIAYGLGVQMLDNAAIETNLLPKKIATSMTWARKGRNFTIAASVLLAFSLISFASAKLSAVKYTANQKVRSQIEGVIRKAGDAKSKISKENSRQNATKKILDDQKKLLVNRDVIPLLTESIISCLPSVKNTPGQAELLQAFDAGNVDKILSFERKDRKQLFVTSLIIAYTDSLVGTNFDKVTKRRERAPSGGMEMDEEMMMEMMMMSGMGGEFSMGGGGGFGSRGFGKVKKELSEGDAAGFVVVMEGYSPYENIMELMDPTGVANDKSRWGFITRIGNLSTRGFTIFEKEMLDHFQLKIHDVDPADTQMPEGIGIETVVDRIPRDEENDSRSYSSAYSAYSSYSNTSGHRIEVEEVLIDPMTGEEMSKTFDLITQEEVDNNPRLSEKDIGIKKLDEYDNEKYVTRDHWFRLNIKIKWANAPLNNSADQSSTAKQRTSKKSVRSSASRKTSRD
jgi:type IV pilus assembly protein PilM